MDFLFGRSAEIEIRLNEKTGDRHVKKVTHISAETHEPIQAPLFYDGETISGKAIINLRKPKLEHKGIHIEIIGLIELFGDRANQYEFLSKGDILSGPDIITSRQVEFPFGFKHVNKPYESYSGVNTKCKYFIRVRIVKRLADIVQELEFCVHTVSSYSQPSDKLLKPMEVGIEGSLHIDFQYNKSRYHLEDVVIGQISFTIVRLKIKHMELCIIRKESAGFGQNQYQEPEIIAKFDIMDGPPTKGEQIPLRVYLKPYTKAGKLTPTMKDIAKRFSVRYYLHLKLMDEDERTYYKQQEIVLWRKPDDSLGLNTYQRMATMEDDKEEKHAKENGEAEDSEEKYNGEEAAL